MKHQYDIFISEMIKHNDKQKAYQAAYPGAHGASLRTNSSKLYHKLKEHIDPVRDETRAQLMEELKAEAKAQMMEQYCTMHDKRVLLAKMIKGEHKTKKHIKLNGELKDVYDDMTPLALLRAIDMDTKLENEWYLRPVKTTKAKQEQEKGEDPMAESDVFDICIEGITPPHTDTGLRMSWHKANPDKCKFISTSRPDAPAQIGYMTYSELPPWQENPNWYDEQRVKLKNATPILDSPAQKPGKSSTAKEPNQKPVPSSGNVPPPAPSQFEAYKPYTPPRPQWTGKYPFERDGYYDK